MGGGSLLVYYSTLPQLLTRVYSDFKWELNQFSQVQDIWTDEQLAIYFVEKLKKNHSEREINFILKEVKNKKFKGIHPLTQILRSAYPKHNWVSSMPALSKKSQYLLRECLHRIFTAENTILLEEYKHPDLNLELDYFYPQFNLAFEYQVKIQCLYCSLIELGTSTLS